MLALASTSLGVLLQYTTLRRDGHDARIDFGPMPALPRADPVRAPRCGV